GDQGVLRRVPAHRRRPRRRPGRGGAVHGLPAVGAGHPDRLRHGPRRRPGAVHRRAARRRRGPQGRAVRRAGRAAAGPGAGGGRHRPLPDVRDERGQALPVHPDREAAAAPDARAGARGGLPAVAGRGAGPGQPGADRLPGGDRGEGDVRQRVPDHQAARTAGAVRAGRRGRRGDPVRGGRGGPLGLDHGHRAPVRGAAGAGRGPAGRVRRPGGRPAHRSGRPRRL
ncbi:MAG: Uracil-DNA glycosylase, putative family 6, partial [uncultured Corynebacteriales bacterium]